MALSSNDYRESYTLDSKAILKIYKRQVVSVIPFSFCGSLVIKLLPEIYNVREEFHLLAKT